MLPIDQAYAIVKWFLVGAIVAVGTVMGVVAALTRYTHFIVHHPVKFALETALVAVMGALPIYLVSKHRDALTASTTFDFAVLSFKFMAFWFLMELTGANAMFFQRAKDVAAAAKKK